MSQKFGDLFEYDSLNCDDIEEFERITYKKVTYKSKKYVYAEFYVYDGIIRFYETRHDVHDERFIELKICDVNVSVE